MDLILYTIAIIILIILSFIYCALKCNAIAQEIEEKERKQNEDKEIEFISNSNIDNDFWNNN